MPIRLPLPNRAPDAHQAFGRPDPTRGVFETLLVREGRAQAADLHLQRLAESVAVLYGERLPTDTLARVRSCATALSGPHRVRITALPRAAACRSRSPPNPCRCRPPSAP